MTTSVSINPEHAAGAAIAAERYGTWRAWYTFFVLELQILLIGVDIGIVTLLVKPIETALGVNDVGFATISATPIALGIAITYYPAGLLADTFKRRDILALGAFVWLAAALLAARANSPALFFLARLVAGIGTGIAGPSVFSLLTDAFSREQRAFATSAFSTGLAIGGGFALTFCGALVAATAHIGTVSVAGLTFAPWQQCFLGVALAGAFSIAIVMTVREPRRCERSQASEGSMTGGIRAFVTYMRQHGFLWIAMLGAISIAATSSAALSAWAPTFGMRRYGDGILSQIALLGTLSAAGALLGSIGFGVVAQRLINIGKSYLIPRVLVAVCALGGIACIAFPLMPSWPLAVALIGIAGTAASGLQVLIPVGIQETAPNEVRGQIVGLNGILGFLPAFAGATLVAYLAEHAFAKHGGLGPAFSWVGGITWLAALLLFAICEGPYRRAMNGLREIGEARKDVSRTVSD